MITKVYVSVMSFIRSLKLRFIIKDIRQNATLVGAGHQFGLESRVFLREGGKKENVILNDHAEVFGTIAALKYGQIIMGEWSKIGPGTRIEAVTKVEIGKDTAIAAGVTIRDNNSHPISPKYRRKMRRTPHNSVERYSSRSDSKPIIIGENVWIGENARICKGVTIGDNAIIAADSVVTKNVPANAVAAGNPAKIVKENIDLLPYPDFSKENKDKV